MYVGIGINDKKRVLDEDAFSYACECCKNDPEEYGQEFLDIAKESKTVSEFADELVSWFYSGSWIYREE